MQRLEIHVKNETLALLPNYCITRGLPLPPADAAGGIKDVAGVCVTDKSGKVLPSEGRILQRRKDGSIEWVQMDILVDVGGQEVKSIFFEPRSAPKPEVKNPVIVREAGPLVTLSNGLTEVTLSRDGGSLIRKLVLNGKTLVDDRHLVDLVIADGGGKVFRASLGGPYKVTVTHQNRLRTVVTIEGKHAARDKTTYLDFALRFELTAGVPDLKLEHTFYCRDAKEGKLPVRFMKLVMPTAMDGSSTKLLRQQHRGHDWTLRDHDIAENVEIVGSSVGDIDNYAAGFKGAAATHPCAGGSIFLRNGDSLHENWAEYPFHMRPGQASGFRADLSTGGVRVVFPGIGWKDKNYTIATTFEHFRQLHPKSIMIDENVITYSIWPEWSIPMQVMQGVSKSHIICITGEPKQLTWDEVEDHCYRWEYGYVEPLDISYDPEWFVHCQALECQHFLKYQPQKYPLMENMIEPVPAAGNPSRHTYDRQPATGMFHFGDIVTPDATNCQNNEDDMNVLFPLQHFLRTGQTYAWDYGKEAARHYMEVDFCEWSTDPRQRGGLIPHTGNHFVGNVYPSHQWAEGILAYYYLTGDERARNVVISVGDNNVYYAFEKTGLVCCDGREAGMPLVNLAAAYRLTGDEKYIKAARHIIQNFFIKYTNKDGVFQYPYPQNTQAHPHKYITGYGDWSSFAGIFRLWELTGDEEFRTLAVRLLKQAIKPGSFSVNDIRGMDFMAAWCLGVMTGDMESVVKLVESAVPMLLRRGGHPLRRLHFLKEMDKRGLIDEKNVGNRAGQI